MFAAVVYYAERIFIFHSHRIRCAPNCPDCFINIVNIYPKLREFHINVSDSQRIQFKLFLYSKHTNIRNLRSTTRGFIHNPISPISRSSFLVYDSPANCSALGSRKYCWVAWNTLA